MERIVYNKTLDTHKSGIQFTLQGFETADKLSRQIVISLMANGDAIDLPLEQMEAVMYVNTPSGAEPSINACIIKGNTIIYDVLPITEEGITTMQLKLIGSSGDGTPTVLATPRFAVEVMKSDTDDESIKNSPTYTAVEKAISMAKAAYDSRLLRISLDSDCVFTAYYEGGTVYESDVLKELFLKGDVLLSQSYAKGGSGVRDGEDTDNSMYYSQVAKSMALETKASGEDALAILDEVKKHGVYTVFSANFETGELVYESPKYDFEIDKDSGELDIIGKAYDIEGNMVLVIEEWLKGFGVVFPAFKECVDKHEEDIENIKKTAETHLTKEEVNSVLMQYNTSAQSCTRDGEGNLVFDYIATLIADEFKLSTLPKNESNPIITETINAECEIQLEALQPHMDIRVSFEWDDTTASTAENSYRTCRVWVYDAENDTLFGESSSRTLYEGANTFEFALSEDKIEYIYDKSPRVKIVIESRKGTTGSGVNNGKLKNIYLTVTKAKHFAFELLK